jgi:hypothetical protein
LQVAQVTNAVDHRDDPFDKGAELESVGILKAMCRAGRQFLDRERRKDDAQPDPWSKNELMQPDSLAKILNSSATPPTIICVAFPVLYRQRHVLHKRFAGPASKPEGLKALREAVVGDSALEAGNTRTSETGLASNSCITFRDSDEKRANRECAAQPATLVSSLHVAASRSIQTSPALSESVLHWQAERMPAHRRPVPPRLLRQRVTTNYVKEALGGVRVDSATYCAITRSTLPQLSKTLLCSQQVD